MTIINPNTVFQNSDSISEKLSIANKKIAGQFFLNEKIVGELINTTSQLALQNEIKDKQAAELIKTYEELTFQNNKNEKQAAEIIIKNEKIAAKNIEREIQTAELNIANRELLLQNQEKEKRALELIIANKELAFQNTEKEKRASELIKINSELENALAYHKEYIDGLGKMMFITSHKIRIPVANILGLSKLLEDAINSPEELKLCLNYIQESALSLDAFTKELTLFILNLKQKENT